MSGVHLERRCDVIIPVKDAVDWVERSVVELLRSTPREELGEVVVVDDRSSPASKKALEEICRAAQVSLVDNTGSKGFGASCNLGASRGTAPYLLLLNSDCLVTPGAVRKLVSALERDPSVAVACPLSNNSPLLTLPLSPGRSYIEMNALLEEAARAALPEDSALEACTIVGNCLLVRRTAWEALGGFDPVWGRGYGEETDLQMRALRRGWRGVCCIDTYVYHQGSASFRNEADLELLQQRNHRLFLERWGEDYARLEARCASRNPTEVAAKRLAGLPGARDLRPDLLFVLPALEQGIGGAQAVVDLCNELLRQGLEARCVVLGSPPAARAYGEMMLSGPLYVSGEPALLAMEDLRPRCCVATHFSTALPVHACARARGARTIGFVQGLETYFIDGLARQDTIDGYAAMDRLVVTSRWLREGVQR
ncbi:MAG: glycosyltransferase, partial [Deltaproteobacteria bacterium]|nr:glycosyltransferase [Deltaproteobacteria bacterium]